MPLANEIEMLIRTYEVPFVRVLGASRIEKEDVRFVRESPFDQSEVDSQFSTWTTIVVELGFVGIPSDIVPGQYLTRTEEVAWLHARLGLLPSMVTSPDPRIEAVYHLVRRANLDEADTVDIRVMRGRGHSGSPWDRDTTMQRRVFQDISRTGEDLTRGEEYLARFLTGSLMADRKGALDGPSGEDSGRDPRIETWLAILAEEGS